MPMKTTSQKSRTSVLGRDPGLEALGLGLPGDETGELVERAGIGAGQPQRGAPTGDPPRLPPELVDEAVDRAAGRRRVRQALGMPADRRISNEVIDELLAGASSEEEIAGPGGLLAQLTRRLVERAMEVELTEHLGYEPHCEPPGGAGNQRNGTTPKTLICEHGEVAIDAPRDRDGSFAPKIVNKRQRRFVGFDDKILALYSRGLSTRDVEAHLQEIYGVKVGHDLITKVTDAVMDDVRARQQRPLEDVYPVVFLDCLNTDRVSHPRAHATPPHGAARSPPALPLLLSCYRESGPSSCSSSPRGLCPNRMVTRAAALADRSPGVGGDGVLGASTDRGMEGSSRQSAPYAIAQREH